MNPPNTPVPREMAFPSLRLLAGLGLAFICLLPLARALLGEAALAIVLLGWPGGIGLGLWAFVRAVKEVWQT